jgi:hypothetical protein
MSGGCEQSRWGVYSSDREKYKTRQKSETAEARRDRSVGYQDILPV